MAQAFDISLDSLQGRSVAKPNAAGRGAGNSAGEASGTFFLETFGCQMNDHDSEKVAGVLASRGYRQVASPDDAALMAAKIVH